MRLAPILLLFACALTGCADRDDAPGGIAPETFVAVIAELRIAAAAPDADSTFDARRAEILRRHGVTAAELRAFADRHADDPALMATVWDSIGAVLRRADEGTRTPPGVPAVTADSPAAPSLVPDRLRALRGAAAPAVDSPR